MDLNSIIGRLVGGHAILLAGSVFAVIVASEAVKPIIQVAQTVSNVVPS